MAAKRGDHQSQTPIIPQNQAGKPSVELKDVKRPKLRIIKIFDYFKRRIPSAEGMKLLATGTWGHVLTLE
jgi:hypothetical protein